MIKKLLALDDYRAARARSAGSPLGLVVRDLVVGGGFGACGRSTITATTDLRAGRAGSPRTCMVAATSSAA